MESSAAIVDQARQRANEMKLPYAGALMPQEAYALLQANPQTMLVDVRTRAEWDWVGHVPGAVEIEWNSWPDGQPNPDFIAELKAKVPATSPVLFLCRSGARSHNAAVAATRAGYSQSFNVLQGFEGDKDDASHRNTVGGWRAAGLPWTQT
jgi:rhodanese-related sulfurtransferase